MASFGKAKEQSAKYGKVVYPPDHKLGMRVPKGGSDCAKCEYVKPEQECSNNVFVSWQGSNKIPAPIDEYCCDMFEIKEK